MSPDNNNEEFGHEDANMASGEVNDNVLESDSDSDAQTLMLPGGAPEVVLGVLGPEDEDRNDWWHPSAWMMEEFNYRYTFMDVYVELERL